MGRKRTPTALRVLRGNNHHRPLPPDEPTPETGAEMPPGLSEEAQAQWPTVSKMLEEAGVLTQMDALALGLYCETYAQWRFATDQVASRPIVKRKGIPHRSPYFPLVKETQDRLLKIMVEFGMTPASRSKVTVSKRAGSAKKANRFALIHGGGATSPAPRAKGEEE